jgi:23S rRNA pseudouridine2457 synthase
MILPLLFAVLSGLAHEHIYIALYKPALTLCSLKSDDERGKRKHRDARMTLHNLSIPEELRLKLHIVGRLDRDSEGLLLLSDDGQFTARVLSGKCHKTYWAFINGGEPALSNIEDMRKGGLNIRGSITRPPLSVDIISQKEREASTIILPQAVPGMNRGSTWLQVILNEGKNRQVRKITACAGHKTVRLCRVAVGSFRLKDHEDLWEPGSWKFISKDDVLSNDIES